MPERSRVDAFIAAVVAEKHTEAIEQFYHEDASMQENHEPPRKGRAGLVAHEIEAHNRIQSTDTHPPKAILVDGDHVSIHWVFDVINKKGARFRLEEIALQRWEGDRIKEERFFYDTAKAWHPVEEKNLAGSK